MTLPILLLSSMIHACLSESYTLTYHHTYLEASKPEFFADSYLNDIPFYWYDSSSRWLEPLAPWRRKMATPKIWYNLNTELQKHQEQMKAISPAGNATVQYIHGCTASANGSVEGFFQIALSGIEILRFDTGSGTFSSEIEVGAVRKMLEALNSNRTLNQRRKEALDVTCGKDIHFLLTYANASVHRKAEPMVIVSEIISNSTVALDCRAYGHYPRDIAMTWIRNGRAVPERQLPRLTLPLTDGTYLSRVLVDVTSGPEDIYTCEVTHSSLKTPLTAQWMKSRLTGSSYGAVTGGLSSGTVIALTLTGVLFVTVAVFGILVWERERRARMRGSVFNNDSSS
ncbi:class I histocompatibility antigen, F10 alpha chain [Spea bombifrons]|uniref:class I histocompatibility antigen, F10 alpha chain n=1 Tax=Spea bombifrons TaxID=233779 RepID=UPI00234918D4|nr:class I histocompatibility antigen, F10 alpha chain [Spea bombifrons]